MAYRIATLIHFYRITMERTIGTKALMSSVLTEYVLSSLAVPSLTRLADSPTTRTKPSSTLSRFKAVRSFASFKCVHSPPLELSAT